jgi:hypothetical protein
MSKHIFVVMNRVLFHLHFDDFRNPPCKEAVFDHRPKSWSRIFNEKSCGESIASSVSLIDVLGLLG